MTATKKREEILIIQGAQKVIFLPYLVILLEILFIFLSLARSTTMTFVTLISFAGAMFLLAVTPGPGVFATVSRGLSSGFGAAAAVTAGIICGDILFLLFAIYGLAAVATQLDWLFTVINYLEAGYLLYLGYSLLKEKPQKIEPAKTGGSSWFTNFTAGLSIPLGNPKVLLFYLAFLPTFINLAALSILDAALIVEVVAVVLGATMLVYGYMAARAQQLFSSKNARRRLNFVAGSVMIAVGVVLFLKA